MIILRALLNTAAVLLATAIWFAGFRAPFFNLVAGPANAALLAMAAIVGVPGGRGRRPQAASLAMYSMSLAASVLAISAELVPWHEGVAPHFATLLIGVHGEGLPGALGLIAGAALAVLAPRTISPVHPSGAGGRKSVRR